MKSIAERWNRSSVNYAVANGLEGYPERLGRDIDVVVARRDLETASEAVRSIFQQHGWRVVVQHYGDLVQHFGIPPGSGDLLIIDLFPGLRWGPVWLVEQPSTSTVLHDFCRDPWVSLVKRVLLHVLVAPSAKFAGRPDRLHLSAEEHSAALIQLPRLLGADLASRLLATIEQQDVAGLEALRPRLRAALVRRSIASAPLRALHATVQWATMRVTFATARPLMPTVSIVSPEGVDRRPVLESVVRQAQERLGCPYVVTRRGNAPADLARRASGRLGAAQLARYALEGLVRHLADRRLAVDFNLVVYERSALDMLVEQVRYGRVSRWLMRLLLRVLPQPDLVVLLDEVPDHIRGRHPELDEKELRRQREIWTGLVRDGAVHLVLPADGDPQLLGQRIVGCLVERFVRGY